MCMSDAGYGHSGAVRNRQSAVPLSEFRMYRLVKLACFFLHQFHAEACANEKEKPHEKAGSPRRIQPIDNTSFESEGESTPNPIPGSFLPQRDVEWADAV